MHDDYSYIHTIIDGGLRIHCKKQITISIMLHLEMLVQKKN